MTETYDEKQLATTVRLSFRSKGFVLRGVWALLTAWHLLSLDAATVAVVWSIMLARTSAVHLAGHELLILGLGTWLVYVGDRMLDGRSGRDPACLRARHLFYARYRRVLLPLAGAAGLLLLVLICQMPARLRLAYAGIFALSVVYFVFVHWLDAGRSIRAHQAGVARVWSRWRLKEAAVATLFSAACAAPAWAAETQNHPLLALATLLFAALCWLNCTAIELWEGGRGRGIGREAALLAAAALLVTVRTAGWLPGSAVAVFPVGLAVGASALLLLVLDRTRLSAGRLRVLADIALLTPLAFLPR